MADPATALDGRQDTTGSPQDSLQTHQHPRISRRRLMLVDALIAVTTVLAVVGMLSVFANRLLFSPDNWEKTSSQLLEKTTIRNATANYAVDQLYSHVDVAGLIQSALPTRLQALAGPAAGALQNVAVQGAELALGRPRVQDLWASANRAADEAFIALVNGGKGAIGVNQGVVTLDLSSVVSKIASRLGLPASLSKKLPPNIAHLTVLKSNQLKLVQNGGNFIRHFALWLTILVPIFYGLAILLATGHRRRTLMTVGFAIVFAGILGVAARSILQSQVTDSLVHQASLRLAVSDVLAIMTEILGTIAGAFLLVGSVVVAAAWFAGPARVATTARRGIAHYLREYHVGALALTAGLMLLVFIWDPIPATGKPAGIVAFMVLALLGIEALRRQTTVEFPGARKGEFTASLRQRLAGLRDRRHHGDEVTAPSRAPVVDDLERLAALHHDGALSGEEYEAAKASLLRG